MTKEISTLEQALQVVEALELEEQVTLVNIISKRLNEQRRSELLEEVAEARQYYQQGNVKRGSVADLMSELDE